MVKLWSSGLDSSKKLRVRFVLDLMFLTAFYGFAGFYLLFDFVTAFVLMSFLAIFNCVLTVVGYYRNW